MRFCSVVCVCLFCDVLCVFLICFIANKYVCVCNVLQLSTSHYTTKKNRSANKIDMCSFNVYAVYIYIYGDRSKGPCKEFYLRKPCMLCWKPSRKFFFEFAKVKFYISRKFRESWVL